MFDEIVNEIETRCKNPLETQSSIAQSYANMLRYLDFISDDKIKVANNAIKARYPSKSGLARVKKMAWAIVEKRPALRAVELGDSAASQALSTPEVLSTQQAESTPAPIH